MAKKVVVVIPTFNEKDNISQLIDEVLGQNIKAVGFDIYVLVSDSHSPDGTGEVVEKIAKKNKKVKLLDVKKRGIGVGLKKGYEYAFGKLKADIVLQMDADFSHDPKELPKLLAPFNNGFNFCQGSRFIKGGKNELEWYRRFFSWGANVITRFLVDSRDVHEFTTSYRAFDREIFSKIDFSDIPWQGKSFVFQPAFLYGAIRAGAKIKEVPIVFVDRERGYSKLAMVSYIRDLLMFGMKVRLGMKKSKRFVKFCCVGFTAFFVQTFFFEIFRRSMPPENATAVAAEISIVINFFLSNFWTFSDHKLKTRQIPFKFLQFNLTVLGSVVIQWLTIRTGRMLFGDEVSVIYFFYIMGVGIGLIWNYFFYNKLIWKTK